MSATSARVSAVLLSLTGLALLVVSFALDWFEFPGGPVDLWGAFSVVDLLIGLSILLALSAGPAAVFAERRGLAVTLATISANFAVIAFALLCWRVIDPPPGSVGREAGVWVGLVLQALILVGSFAAMGGGSPPRVSSGR